MIRPSFFVETLKERGLDFYVGVPDSLLKNVCAYLADNLDRDHNLIAANEGGAIGLAAGYYLATNRIPIVYMQNSGEGNVINPLTSLTDNAVYNIPVLLIIGWRGQPGVHDEPQHIKQGQVTLSLLDVLGIKYEILQKDEDLCQEQIKKAVSCIEKNKEVYAFVVEKDTFDAYTLKKGTSRHVFTLSRETAIQTVAASLGKKDAVVATTGMISRELFEYRARKKMGHDPDFLTVGSMGHANQIALGIALQKTDRRIWCFDGDGACLMHLGGMAIIGSKQPTNYVHVIFNNGAHDSVGGQPTVGLEINLPQIAQAVGYKYVYSVDTIAGLQSVLSLIKELPGPVFLQICVKKGNRADLGRPTTTPIENKELFMNFLKD